MTERVLVRALCDHSLLDSYFILFHETPSDDSHVRPWAAWARELIGAAPQIARIAWGMKGTQYQGCDSKIHRIGSLKSFERELEQRRSTSI